MPGPKDDNETDEARGTGKQGRGTEDKAGQGGKPGRQKKGGRKKKAVAGDLDLDDPGTRGRVFQRAPAIEDWVEELKAEGFSEFYSQPVTNELLEAKEPKKRGIKQLLRPDDRIQPKGTKRFGEDKLGLKKAFPSGGPDLVAVNHHTKQIFVGDVTAGPWSTAKVSIKPGDKRRFPNESQDLEETVHHLEKTKRDASELAPKLEGKYTDYEVSYQDYYREDLDVKTSNRYVYKPNATPPPVTSTPTADADKSDKTKAQGKAEGAAAVGDRKVTDAKPTPTAKSTDVQSKGLQDRLPKATARMQGNRALRASGQGKVRALAIGVRAWRVTRTLGKVVVLCFVPLKALDVALDVALELWDRDREKEEKKRRQKQRALEEVFKQDDRIQSLIRSKILDNTARQETFIEDWNRHKKFPGFMYARLRATLELETFRDYQLNESETLTTYSVASLDVFPTTWNFEFELTDLSGEKELVKTESDIKRLLAQDIMYPSAIKKIVRKQVLAYTIVPPLITPFDIVTTKINNLFLDIASFVADFSQSRQQILDGFRGFKYEDNYSKQFAFALEFPHPLDSSKCQYCLAYLHWAAKKLSEHPLTQQDLHGNLEDPKKGWKRRVHILMALLDGEGTTYKKNFSYLSLLVKDLVKRGEKTEEAVDALQELYIGTRAIWHDLERIEANYNKPEYLYLAEVANVT